MATGDAITPDTAAWWAGFDPRDHAPETFDRRVAESGLHAPAARSGRVVRSVPVVRTVRAPRNGLGRRKRRVARSVLSPPRDVTGIATAVRRVVATTIAATTITVATATTTAAGWSGSAMTCRRS